MEYVKEDFFNAVKKADLYKHENANKKTSTKRKFIYFGLGTFVILSMLNFYMVYNFLEILKSI